MKKFFTSKKCLLMLAFAGLMSVACGLKISNITLSNAAPQQGEHITMTTNYVATSEFVADDYYNLYAVRVPSDWEAPALTVKTYTGSGEEVVYGDEIAMISCPAYGEFLQFCFPKDGYKWIGFQSENIYKIQTSVESIVELVAGQEMGEYELDITVGAWKQNPSTELMKDGQINYQEVFGWSSSKDDVQVGDGILNPYYKSSEYLLMASSISKAEFDENVARIRAMDIRVTITNPKNPDAGPATYPVAPEIANILEKDEDEAIVAQGDNLKVKVVQKNTTGIVAAEADAEAVEVVAGEGCVNVAAACGVAAVYNAAGVMTDSKAIANGSATLRAHKGVCLVQIANGAGKVVKKVVVK